MLNNFQKQEGFTLMELVVVLGIFTMSALIITEIFIIANNSQRKVLEYQKLQSDASYTMEIMARAARLGTIDYESYGNVAIPESRLLLKDSSGKKAAFRKASDQDGGCADAQSSPCIISGADLNADGVIGADEEASINPKGVKIEDLKFFIFPATDPYYKKTCDSDGDCISGKKICDMVTNLCEAEDQQPAVSIIFSAMQASGAEPAKISLQTAVSSREYYR